jgi:hypothetical protein
VGTAAYVPAHVVGRAEEDAFAAFQEGQDTADQYNKQAAAFRNAGNQVAEAGNIASQATSSAGKTNTVTNILGSAAGLISGWFK